ncbi:MAG TPA: Asp23/Gls24 family envelope stress response protein [bacterium]|nr:Asp23/Gls24 family envelope stress response protein [bacterium]HOL35272.1 Asp23/Gls24 family envelope stress response protein [bacterium]HPP08786.1 Asp23/Gls24 family envelope stress response protein [bacterium]
MPNEEKEQLGSVKIDDEVIGTIAAIAAKSIPGVYKIATSFVGGIALFFRKIPDAGVKVSVKEDGVRLNLGIIVEYGINIPELTWKVQKAIKEEVEKATGFKISQVNIVVEGIHHPDFVKG